MSMRPALKKIVKLLKEDEKFHGFCFVDFQSESKIEKFIKTHCIHLRNPVPIKAGTKWTSKTSGTLHGEFKVDCNVIGVINYVGRQIVLDKRSSSCIGGEKLDYLEQLSSLDTDLLEKIANEL